MKEPRPHYQTTLVSYPEIWGRKSTKFTQYRASWWRSKGQKLITTTFYPRIPKINSLRNDYFATRYRLQIGGAWFKIDCKRYTMLTQDEVYQVIEQYKLTVIMIALTHG